MAKIPQDIVILDNYVNIVKNKQRRNTDRIKYSNIKDCVVKKDNYGTVA